jgi:crotonobetainyl-CoA:carnitine CoA-transferase CaiB-like acyl-CoA transferase
MRTPTAVRQAPREPGADTDAILTEAGYSEVEITDMRASGSVAGPRRPS